MTRPFRWALCFVRYSTGIRRWSKNSTSAVIPSWRPPFRPWWRSVRITTRIRGRDRWEKTVKFLAPHPTPSANAAGSKGESPYDALSAKSFNYHFGRWKKALKEQKGKCMVCFDTARNEHNTCDCPVLKNLGFKIDKCTPSNNPCNAASRVVTEIPQPPALPAPAPTPSSAPPPASGDSQLGSMVAPGAFSVATEYDLGTSSTMKGNQTVLCM